MKSFYEFVENPTGANYRKILDQLAAGPEYRPYARHIEQIHSLLDAGEYEKAFEACRRSTGTLLLSPEVHMLAGHAARKLGEEGLFKLERVITSACIRGILDTGDGSKEDPYVVSVTGDEYFVLEVLKKQSASQALVKNDERYLDLITTTEGEEIYFDVTKPYMNLRSQFGSRAEDSSE